jgi:hypothetical protein
MRVKTSGSDKIAEVLFDALIETPDEQLGALRAALEEFKQNYHRSYDGVRKQPFCRKMIDAIEEAYSYRKDLELTEK